MSSFESWLTSSKICTTHYGGLVGHKPILYNEMIKYLAIRKTRETNLTMHDEQCDVDCKCD